MSTKKPSWPVEEWLTDPPDRPESTPIYDSREVGGPYELDLRLGRELIGRHLGLEDPFHNTRITIGWRDLLKCLVRRKMELTVTLDAPRKVIEAVMELDDNYRGNHGTARRRSSDAAFDRGLRGFAASLDDDGEVPQKETTDG